MPILSAFAPTAARSAPHTRLCRAARLLSVAAMLLLPSPGCMLTKPSNHRDWSPDLAKLARADLQGPLVHVHNIRNCDYRSEKDYSVRYYDKTFNLDELNSVWFVVVPFPESPNLAHTMLSFGFADRDYLAVSVEIRREKGETYAPLKGSLNQFELMYVVGDERDLVALRSNHRLNEVYMYRSTATAEKARELFLDVMERVNQLEEKPEYYNTFTNNCTTNIMRHINRIAPNAVPYDYHVLLPGLSDRYAYELGLIASRGSFEATKEAARVNELAYRYRESPDFSQLIRR